MGPAFMAPPRHEGPSPGWLAFPFIVVAGRRSEKVLFRATLVRQQEIPAWEDIAEPSLAARRRGCDRPGISGSTDSLRLHTDNH
jgi:hypothetical protein